MDHLRAEEAIRICLLRRQQKEIVLTGNKFPGLAVYMPRQNPTR